MKVEIEPRLYPHRGGEVAVGNVYQGKPNQRYFRLAANHTPIFKNIRILREMEH